MLSHLAQLDHELTQRIIGEPGPNLKRVVDENLRRLIQGPIQDPAVVDERMG